MFDSRLFTPIKSVMTSEADKGSIIFEYFRSPQHKSSSFRRRCGGITRRFVAAVNAKLAFLRTGCMERHREQNDVSSSIGARPWVIPLNAAGGKRVT